MMHGLWEQVGSARNRQRQRDKCSTHESLVVACPVDLVELLGQRHGTAPHRTCRHRRLLRERLRRGELRPTPAACAAFGLGGSGGRSRWVDWVLRFQCAGPPPASRLAGSSSDVLRLPEKRRRNARSLEGENPKDRRCQHEAAVLRTACGAAATRRVPSRARRLPELACPTPPPPPTAPRLNDGSFCPTPAASPRAAVSAATAPSREP